MMIHAYDEIYLDDAMETLGEAAEYASLFNQMAGQEFFDLFVTSGIADEFGKGNVKYISGMSGIELARTVIEQCGKKAVKIDGLPYVDYPPEYWIGWILAYYQWHSGKSFDSIFNRIPYQKVYDLYGVLHEADPSKSVTVFDEMMAAGETNLARYRKSKDLSQSQLADASGVSVRSIQLYEQRQTNINNARHNHLVALARTLGCKVEDILE